MFDLIVLLALLALGYAFGRSAELAHYRSILKREAALRHIPAIASKIPDPDLMPRDTRLVTGSVVISVDYFKRFLSQLRNIVGGRVKAYESLLDRARREAILRMKEEAEAMNANLIFNVKLETASIYKGNGRTIGSVEVLAYGTAFVDTNRYQREPIG